MKGFLFLLGLLTQAMVLQSQSLWFDTQIQTSFWEEKVAVIYPLGFGTQLGAEASGLLWNHTLMGFHASAQLFLDPSGKVSPAQTYQGVISLAQGWTIGTKSSVIGPIIKAGYGSFILGSPRNLVGYQGYSAAGFRWDWALTPDLGLELQGVWGLVFEPGDRFSLPSVSLGLRYKILDFPAWEQAPSAPDPGAGLSAQEDPSDSLEGVQQLKVVDTGGTDARRIILWGSFLENSTALTPRFREQLPAILEYLKTLNNLETLEVQGFIADDGTGAEGLELSLRRAEAVTEILRRELPGVSWSWKTLGLGKASPYGDNRTPQGRSENRRIELVLHTRKNLEKKSEN